VVAELLDQARSLGCDLSAAQADRLLAFEELLVDRAIPQGLIGRGDRSRIRTRHVLDSLRAAAVVEAGDRVAYDLGTGAGLPGIAIAVARPSLLVRLVDARRSRVAFLEMVVEELELPNAEVLAARIETLKGPADLCFARALAPPDEVWRLASRLLDRGGRLVIFIGAGVDVPAVPGVRVELLTTTVLESAGPLAIMARK
jgi:16S rRNA (guanine527-N7)-methyltransferase